MNASIRQPHPRRLPGALGRQFRGIDRAVNIDDRFFNVHLLEFFLDKKGFLFLFVGFPFCFKAGYPFLFRGGAYIGGNVKMGGSAGKSQA
jgi:hypothetical protein